VQPFDNMIDLPAPSHAALSQNFGQHRQDLLATHPPAFDPADHPPHILHHRRVPRPRGGSPVRGLILPHCRGIVLFGWLRLRHWLWSGRGCGPFGAIAVLDPPSLLALLVAVILDTPPGGLLFAVSLLAAERTAQIPSTGIAGIGEKKNTAMPASGQASAQVRLGSEHRSQDHVVLQDQRGNLIPSIPLGTELEIPGDRDCKKPRDSLKILIACKTPSSYGVGAKVSRK